MLGKSPGTGWALITSPPSAPTTPPPKVPSISLILPVFLRLSLKLFNLFLSLVRYFCKIKWGRTTQISFKASECNNIELLS